MAEDLGPCLEWSGTKGGGGYGRYARWGAQRYLHVIVWEATEGPVPAGYVVMHRCDNPACYRRSHLRLGTQRENVQDCIAKGRFRAGEHRKHPPEVVTLILTDTRSSRKLAADIGIPARTIRGIRLAHKEGAPQ